MRQKKQLLDVLGFPDHSKGMWVFVNGKVQVARTWTGKVESERKLRQLLSVSFKKKF